MLNSSVLIRVISFILKTLERWYKGSVIHKIFVVIGRGIKGAWNGSGIKKSLLYSESVVEASVSFLILRWCYRLVNTLSHWARINGADVISGSSFFTLTASFQQNDSAVRAFGFSFIGFGLSLVVIALLRQTPLALIGIAFVFVGLMFAYLSRNLKEKLKTSASMQCGATLLQLLVHDEEAARCKNPKK